jgi:hypothetical protein
LQSRHLDGGNENKSGRTHKVNAAHHPRRWFPRCSFCRSTTMRATDARVSLVILNEGGKTAVRCWCDRDWFDHESLTLHEFSLRHCSAAPMHRCTSQERWRQQEARAPRSSSRWSSHRLRVVQRSRSRSRAGVPNPHTITTPISEVSPTACRSERGSACTGPRAREK